MSKVQEVAQWTTAPIFVTIYAIHMGTRSIDGQQTKLDKENSLLHTGIYLNQAVWISEISEFGGHFDLNEANNHRHQLS